MSSLFEIQSLGNLVLDQVIFETYYPIIFTCLSEKNDLFLCVCCRANKEGKKWLITKTNPNTVISMLQNEITVREAFTAYPDVRITVTSGGKVDGMSVDWNNEQDWNVQTSKSLPDAGEYLDADAGEFDEELSYFESMLKKYNDDDLKEVDIISSRKIEFSHNFSIEFMENLLDEISAHKQLKAEIYRVVYDIIVEKFMKELDDKDIFPIDTEEDEEFLIAA